ncbi:hypothetical protein FDECE_18418, partial [Fusarium decemcellulare]
MSDYFEHGLPQGLGLEDWTSFRDSKLQILQANARLWYDSEGPLTEDDEHGDSPIYKACFLVHCSIPIHTWYARSHEGNNEELAATLFLDTPDAGRIAIHNVYNHLDTLDIGELISEATSTGDDLLVGDFNLQHPLWSGARPVRRSLRANELAHGLSATGMECLTPPGTITFSRSGYIHRGVSTIDLTFASVRIADRAERYRIVDVPGFETDHRVIETTLAIEPRRETRVRRLWKRVDEAKFIQAVKSGLEAVGCSSEPGDLPELSQRDRIDDYIDKISKAVSSAVEQWVPVTTPRASPRFRSVSNPALNRLRLKEMIALKHYRRVRTPLSRRRWEKLKDEGDSMQKLLSSAKWRRSVAAQTKSLSGTFNVAAMGKKLAQPREQPQLPPLEVDGQVCQSNQDKIRSLRESIWRNSSHSSSPPPPLPQPHLDPSRVTYEVDQDMCAADLDTIIDGLLKGKAAGPDEISNEAIKIAKE